MKHFVCLAVLASACNSPANLDEGDPRSPGDPQDTAGDSETGDATGDAMAGDALPGDTLPGDTLQGDATPLELERCGLADFAWLDAAGMGEIVTSTLEHDLGRDFLRLARLTLASEQNLVLARTPDRGVEVHSVRYITQDRGDPIEATGLVMIPDETGTWPVLLFLHGTVGATDICSPSRGVDDTSTEAFTNALILSIIASYGYTVVAPDYIGLKASGDPSPELHPYLVGEPTAIANLDAVRAAERLLLQETGGTLVAGPLAIWGASQGGHAAAFTVRYAPHYAPEYAVEAAVYSIPPTDFLGHAQAALTEIRSATANTALFLATAQQWYRIDDGMAEVYVSPYDTLLQPDLMSSCSPSTLDGITALDQLFTPALLAAAPEEDVGDFQPWACIFREAGLTTTSVPRANDVPALFVLGENDTLVDPAIERAAFATLCASGERLVGLECAGAGHTEAFFWSLDNSLDFIEARLNGDAMPASTCQPATAAPCANTP